MSLVCWDDQEVHHLNVWDWSTETLVAVMTETTDVALYVNEVVSKPTVIDEEYSR